MKCLLVCFSASEWCSGSESQSVKGVFVLHRSLTHPHLKDWSYASCCWCQLAILLSLNSAAMPKLPKATACLTILGREEDCWKLLWVPYWEMDTLTHSLFLPLSVTHTHPLCRDTASIFPYWRGLFKRMSQIRSQMSVLSNLTHTVIYFLSEEIVSQYKQEKNLRPNSTHLTPTTML